VHPDAAELSSLANTLNDMLERAAAIAKRYEGTEREDVAFRLRESERSLRQAIRNVNTAAKSLG
jgi:ElaB/YqjD/DUF883 family membrane-anchored ribosome-binding protein